MASRIDIINFLKSLDDIKLQKLYDIAVNVRMLFPEDDLLLNANMSQMIVKAEELSDIYFPEWDKSNSDFGRFLIELVALFSEKDFWYANMYGNETVLRKMGIYSNAYLRAIELGVQPTLNTLATGVFGVTFAPKDPSLMSTTKPYTTYLPGSLVIKRNSSSSFYTNHNSFQVPDSLASTYLTLDLKSGRPFTNSYVFNGEHVYINDKNIDISTIRVTIDGSSWRLVPQFGASSKVDKHFIVVPEQNGAAKIYFGDGVNGAAPRLGSSIDVFYVFGDGTDSNDLNLSSGTFGTVRESSERAVENISAVSSQASGGFNAQTLSEIVSSAPKISRIRGVIINEEDLVDYLTLKTDIAKSAALYNNGTIVFYALKTDRSDLYQDTARASSIESEISNITVNIGYVISCQQSVVKSIPPLLVRVKTSPLTNNTKVKSEVESICRSYFDPLINGDYGKNFEYNDLYLSIINNVKGIVRLDILDNNSPTSQYVSTINMAVNNYFEEPITSDGDPNQNIFVEVDFL